MKDIEWLNIKKGDLKYCNMEEKTYEKYFRHSNGWNQKIHLTVERDDMGIYKYVPLTKKDEENELKLKKFRDKYNTSRGVKQ